MRVALMFTYAFLVIIEVESSFQENKTSTEIYKNPASKNLLSSTFRLFVFRCVVFLCLLFERARAKIGFTEILTTRARSPLPNHNERDYHVHLSFENILFRDKTNKTFCELKSESI